MYELRFADSLAGIHASDWNALVDPNDPFTDYRFLRALETSACVGPHTGWLPNYVLAYAEDRLRGAIPLYIKGDSYGEFIFDWAWADAAMANGISYYPKLVVAVPFTPAAGNRILVGAEDDSRAEIIDALVGGVMQVAEEQSVSSLHFLFCREDEQKVLSEKFDLMPRLTHQFHWDDQGYQSFDDYLGALRNSARKNVRRERKKAAASGLKIEILSGRELSDIQWRALYTFYLDTTGRKWGSAYLNERFFARELREGLVDNVVATFASRDDTPVAGALFFRKGKHLYGRYWGTLESHDALHFELCYYLPIEYCIAEGLRHYEAGAQGAHKLRRGMMPCPTYSAHWLRHPGLRGAVDHYLDGERDAIGEEMKYLGGYGPFKREGKGSDSKRPNEENG
jgi:uncharacterized protein